jgi:hypothetical protein
MEGGLQKAPLMQPGFSVVGDESFTEQRLKDLVRKEVFVIVLLILLEDMLNAIRVVDQVGGPDEEAYPDNITVLLGHGQSKT